MLCKHLSRVGLAFGLGLAAALTILQPAAHAQTQAFSASLGGVVHDASEAAIPGAKVTLTSQEQGFVRSFTTDGQGRYSFATLPPSTYTLSVEAKGFSTYKQEGMVLTAGQASSQSIALQLGQLT